MPSLSLALSDMKRGEHLFISSSSLSVHPLLAQLGDEPGPVCSSVVHRMLHVHGEDVPSSLSSYSTWYISSILKKKKEKKRRHCWTCEDTDRLARWKMSNPVLRSFPSLLLDWSPLSHFQLQQMMSERKKRKKREKTHRKKYIKWRRKLINLTSVIALHDLRSQILCHAMGRVLCRMNIQYIYIYILWLLWLWLFIVHLFCFALFYLTTITSAYGFHCTCKVTFKNYENAVSCLM